MKRIGVASFVLVMGMALPAAAQFDGSTPQGPLNTAKDLYASARYDEALSVLNGLRIGESVDRKSVEQYRSLYLLALGRASGSRNGNRRRRHRRPDLSARRVGHRAAGSRDVCRRAQARAAEIATARYQRRRLPTIARNGRHRNSSSAPCSTSSTIRTWAASSGICAC